jgi:hypothetical protein
MSELLSFAWPSGQAVAEIIKQQSIGRLGRAEEVAAAVL